MRSLLLVRFYFSISFERFPFTMLTKYAFFENISFRFHPLFRVKDAFYELRSEVENLNTITNLISLGCEKAVRKQTCIRDFFKNTFCMN